MLVWSSETRRWAVLAALLCLPVLLCPPWRGGNRGWLFSPPDVGSPDYGRLALELGVACLIAAIVIFFAPAQRWICLRRIWSRTVSRSLFGIGGIVPMLGGLWAFLQIPRAFSADELALVTGQGAPFGSTFHGTVYNGSRLHVVREITIRVSFRPDSPSGAADERDYRVRGLWVPPLGTATFYVDVISLPGTEFDRWQIISARGIRSYWPTE